MDKIRKVKKHFRFKVPPAAYILLEKEHKVLLILRENTGYMDGKWGLPSGHVKKGESPAAGGIRETVEEVGVRVSNRDFTFAHVMYQARDELNDERVHFFFKTNI